MNKGFDLLIRRDSGTDLPDLLQTELPGADNTLGAHLIPEVEGAPVGIIGLGGDMDGDMGTVLPGQQEHARIRHQDRVGSHLLQLLEISSCPGQVTVVGQDVGCHMDPDAMGVGIRDARFHIRRGEISGLGAQAVGLPSYINGIRPEIHRCPKDLQILGGDQELGSARPFSDQL